MFIYYTPFVKIQKQTGLILNQWQKYKAQETNQLLKRFGQTWKQIMIIVCNRCFDCTKRIAVCGVAFFRS